MDRDDNATEEAEAIGLVAGWGRYPLIVAESLRGQGYRVVGLGVRDHADPALVALCDEFSWIGLATVGGAIRRFRRSGVRRAVMAGKIHKVMLYHPRWWVRHRPDWTALRTFCGQLIGAKDRNDDTLLSAIVEAYAAGGVRFEPATNFAPELLVPPGQVAGQSLSNRQWKDVEFGWELAKEIGRLDVGQTVCVKDQGVLAVEAIEGTDQCIRRAGELCRQGGFTVVKVAKPQQDMRFDVPTVGVNTLQSIAAAGGRVLAIEAERTILLDARQFHDAARGLKISVVALHKHAGLERAA